jgi:hypothetical protein
MLLCCLFLLQGITEPGLFKELVNYWVVFQLAQILHQYGLKSAFNDRLEEWSSDLHCIVQLLSKKQQSTTEKNHAKPLLTPYLTPSKLSSVFFVWIAQNKT